MKLLLPLAIVVTAVVGSVVALNRLGAMLAQVLQ